MAVSIDTTGGSNNNSLKLQTNTLKIMFWNIQNLYAHGIMSHDEYKIEQSIGTKKPKTGEIKTTGSSVVMEKKNLKHMNKTIEGVPLAPTPDTFGKHAKRREWIARTINDSGADIVVIAELAIGTKDIANNLNNPQVVEQNKAALQIKTGSFVGVDVGGGAWGPEQLQVDLNKLFDKKGNPWCSAVSAINAVGDFSCKTGKSGIELTKGKNSMLEMYGVLWRSDKVSLGNDPKISIVSTGKNGVAILFNERAPGHIEFFSPKDATKKFFDLFCIHNVYGKGSAAEVRESRGEGISQMTRLNAFNPKAPTVVVGDFNLDAAKKLDADYYKPFTDNLVRRIAGQPSSFTKQGLVSEYDHIFTSADLGKKQAEDAVIDIADKYFNKDYSKALLISDHMPVVAVLTSDSFLPPSLDPPGTPFHFSQTEKYLQVKSVNVPDSLFQAIAAAYLRLHEDGKTNVPDCAKMLRVKVKEAYFTWQLPDDLVNFNCQRIQNFFAEAVTFSPENGWKAAKDWFLETDEQTAAWLRENIIPEWLKGEQSFDEILEGYSSVIEAEVLKTCSAILYYACFDQRNLLPKINPAANLSNLGSNLLNVFKSDNLTLQAAYPAYCNDIASPGVMSGDLVELILLGRILGHPIELIELGENLMPGKTVYCEDLKTNSKGEKVSPLIITRIGERFDFLFGPLTNN